MAELLKNVYNKKFLIKFSDIIKSEYKNFESEKFVIDTLSNEWDNLELKQRTRRITEILGKYLPNNYFEAIDILMKIKNQCTGFPYMIFPDFVAVFGKTVENYVVSMEALEAFTEHSTSEFAVRTFILMDCNRTMEYMKKWATSDNEHVRRLASEGCRPRLPWGESLPVFKKDPKKVLEILELLKEDESLYVRKSVANNLNDIGKDNPQTVIDTVLRWKKINNKDTNWIIRHGCRTLIKENNEEAMKIFGYNSKLKTENGKIIVTPKEITSESITDINYTVNIISNEPLHIRMEYGIYFVKANGKGSLKKFLIWDKTVTGGIVKSIKKHNWINRTTRKHYAGIHKIVLIVNGNEVAEDSINFMVVN